jgi:hypothetical protein
MIERAINLALFFEEKILKIILAGVAGVLIGASSISYLNFVSNQKFEEKFSYLQSDVKKLTKEVSALQNKIEQQVTSIPSRSLRTLPNIVKSSRVSTNNHKSRISEDNAKAKIIDQQKLALQEKTRKIHSGTSMAAK